MSDTMHQSLHVGYSKLDITPEPGCSIAGRPTLGVRRAKKIRDRLHARALHVASGRGYAGYVHLRGEDDHDNAKGFMPLALYENAMSASGWDTGERIVASVRTSLGLDRS